ncbi:MAG: lipopolysaccharide biosynthesis protein, partial [Gemmatimonas sp.]
AADRLFGKALAGQLSTLDGYDAVLIDSPLPARKSRYLAGMDSVLVCMRGEASLMAGGASAAAAVKGHGASNVAIAVTMAETDRRAAPDVEPMPAQVYARAG